jgi:Protein of unknown function (DUF2442)
MHWDVVAVTPEPDWILKVRFADGLSGTVRFDPGCFTGVLEPLRDQRFFDQVFVDRGAVAWPGDIDLAPDAMYREIRHHGEWVLSSQPRDALA